MEEIVGKCAIWLSFSLWDRGLDWYGLVPFFCICYMNNTVNNTGDFAHIGWTRWSLWMKQLLQVFAPYCAWHHRTYFEAPGNIHGVVRLRHLNMQLEKQITNSRTFGFLQFRKFLTRLKVHHIVQYIYIYIIYIYIYHIYVNRRFPRVPLL